MFKSRNLFKNVCLSTNHVWFNWVPSVITEVRACAQTRARVSSTFLRVLVLYVKWWCCAVCCWTLCEQEVLLMLMSEALRRVSVKPHISVKSLRESSGMFQTQPEKKRRSTSGTIPEPSPPGWVSGSRPRSSRTRHTQTRKWNQTNRTTSGPEPSAGRATHRTGTYCSVKSCSRKTKWEPKI